MNCAMPPKGQDGWNEHRMLVLKSLEDLWRCRGEDHKAITDMLVEISALKIKCGIWGVIGVILAEAALFLARSLKE